MVASVTLSAQMLNKQSARTIQIVNDVQVIVLSSLDEPSNYYYVPKSIQLSSNKSIPEISLMLYRNSNNEITGGILHVLITWGITPDQEKGLQSIIQQTDSAAVFMGAATISLVTGMLEFDSSHPRGEEFSQATTVPVRVPTESIHKTAASFNLDGSLAKYIHQQITKRSDRKMPQFSASFEYAVLGRGKGFKESEVLRDEMSTDLSVWIKALKQYGLIKYVTV